MPRNPEYTLTHQLRNIAHHMKMAADRKVASYGLTSSQARMLGYINMQEGIVIQKDIEKAFGRRGASITSMIQTLEKKGFLGRRVSSEDARRRELHLLPKGKKLVREFSQVFWKSEATIINGLDKKERAELARLLAKVEGSLK